MRTNEVLTEMRKRAEARRQRIAGTAPAPQTTRKQMVEPPPQTARKKAEPLTKAEAWAAIKNFAEPTRVAEGLTQERAVAKLVEQHPELRDMYNQAAPSPPPIKAREKGGITPVQLLTSPTGQKWMPVILEKRRQKIMKARPGSFGQRLIEEIEKLAVELQKDRPDLGDQEAFTAVVLAAMSRFERNDPVKLMWKFIEGPESDLELEIALGRPDIQAALAEVGLKL